MGGGGWRMPIFHSLVYARRRLSYTLFFVCVLVRGVCTGLGVTFQVQVKLLH